MGQGYIRNDTANNIADGNVADAADIDGEFDAVVAAFEAATGHTHDGTAAEGGAITVVGPAQDYVGAAGDFSPKTDSLYDLGKTAVRWATGYIDDLDVTTNITVGGTVDGRDVATDGTKLDGIEALADVTDVTNVTAAGALMDSELTSIASVKALDQGVATTDTPTFAGIVTGGNVDGRDVSVDGTKLDTIETNADVTDVTNVTAAGALMDSEVTSLSGIKSLTVPDSTTISTFGASLVDDTNAATALATLGATFTISVEGVTSFVDAVNESFNLVTSTTNTTSLDCRSGNVFSHTLTENTTFIFNNPASSGSAYGMTIKLIQDSTPRTVTWPASVDWAGAETPTISSASGGVDVFVFLTHDGGVTWYGFTAGKDLG